jgi:hypothetical protein
MLASNNMGAFSRTNPAMRISDSTTAVGDNVGYQ